MIQAFYSNALLLVLVFKICHHWNAPNHLAIVKWPVMMTIRYAEDTYALFTIGYSVYRTGFNQIASSPESNA